MKISLSKLTKAFDKYEAAIAEVEDQLSPFVDFNFFIMYQQSDGFVLASSDTEENALLGSCIGFIRKKGILSYEDYKTITI